MANHQERRYLAYCKFKNDISYIMRRIETSSRLGLLPNEVLDEDEITIIRSLGCDAEEIVSILLHHYDSSHLKEKFSSSLREFVDELLPSEVEVVAPLSCLIPELCVTEEVEPTYVEELSSSEAKYSFALVGNCWFRDGSSHQFIPLSELNPYRVDFPDTSCFDIEDGCPVIIIYYICDEGVRRYHYLRFFDLLHILCGIDVDVGVPMRVDVHLPHSVITIFWRFLGSQKLCGLSGVINCLSDVCNIKQMSNLYLIAVHYPYIYKSSYGSELMSAGFVKFFVGLLVVKLSGVVGISRLRRGLPGFLLCDSSSLAFKSAKVVCELALSYWFVRNHLSIRLCECLFQHLWNPG